MSLKARLFFSLLFSIILINTLSAQKVVVKNGLEYLEEDDSADDLNSIEITNKILNVEIKKVKNKRKVISANIEGIEKVFKKRKTLRFRKKRKNASKKCYKEAMNNCKAKEKKGK